ncbi:MAG: B12-binding domain-containing radical SAM protein [Candidatus Anammoxibacter sp.]
MNILMVYPEFPDTFWSYKHALKFIRKKASLPPLGLLTIAAMLPTEWNKRLIDVNVGRTITQNDFEWADYVFISAMVVQRESATKIIKKCKEAGVKIVAGGPLFTSEYAKFDDIDHFVLNEAEITFPLFLKDFEKGDAKRIYSSTEFANISETPAPMWELAEMKRYASMSIQFSRGCPFNCEFCNVTVLFGHKPRTKSSEQIIAELDNLYELGWRDHVFFVDDNFIGNKQYLRDELLPTLIEWRKTRREITFYTEASINLADDESLTKMMVDAGFNMVFIGIETPDEASLAECSKKQNKGRDMVSDVKRLQRAGLQVQGGFIVGFDNDSPSIFQRQIDFIQKSGIVTAMIGVLQAPAGTKLYERMKREGRLLGEMSGDNGDCSTNIVTGMNKNVLREGYLDILRHIYSHDGYYERVKTFLQEYTPPKLSAPLKFQDVMALLRSTYHLGIISNERFHYWRLLIWAYCRNPKLFPIAVRLVISGYHLHKIRNLYLHCKV